MNYLENSLIPPHGKKLLNSINNLYANLKNCDLLNEFIIMKKVEIIKERLCLEKISYRKTTTN